MPKNPQSSDPEPEEERPVYLTSFLWTPTERRRQDPSRRLGSCTDEIRRIKSMAAILEDAVLSELHAGNEDVNKYSDMASHLVNSLELLGREIRDVMASLDRHQ